MKERENRNSQIINIYIREEGEEGAGRVAGGNNGGGGGGGGEEEGMKRERGESDFRGGSSSRRVWLGLSFLSLRLSRRLSRRWSAGLADLQLVLPCSSHVCV